MAREWELQLLRPRSRSVCPNVNLSAQSAIGERTKKNEQLDSLFYAKGMVFLEAPARGNGCHARGIRKNAVRHAARCEELAKTAERARARARAQPIFARAVATIGAYQLGACASRAERAQAHYQEAVIVASLASAMAAQSRD